MVYEPVVERERAKWSEKCPICGERAMLSDAPAFWYSGVVGKVIFCPRHGRLMIHPKT